MAALLFFETFLERLHQLIPAAQRFNLGLFFFGQQALSEFLQPLLGNVGW